MPRARFTNGKYSICSRIFLAASSPAYFCTGRVQGLLKRSLLQLWLRRPHPLSLRPLRWSSSIFLTTRERCDASLPSFPSRTQQLPEAGRQCAPRPPTWNLSPYRSILRMSHQPGVSCYQDLPAQLHNRIPKVTSRPWWQEFAGRLGLSLPFFVHRFLT